MNQTLATDVKLTSIVLVDDHKIIRDGLKALLQGEEVEITGEASNGRELLELLAETTPDVIIMDLNMPEMDGFATLEKIRQLYPEQKVLILSMLENEQYVSKALKAGANGYALKNIGKEELLCGICLVKSGNKFICTEISLNLLEKFQNSPVAPVVLSSEKKTGELSQREIEVLKLIAEGLTNAEIADKLFTSKRTIESHRQNIIEKTQVKNTAALIKYALNNGIIE